MSNGIFFGKGQKKKKRSHPFWDSFFMWASEKAIAHKGVTGLARGRALNHSKLWSGPRIILSDKNPREKLPPRTSTGF